MYSHVTCDVMKERTLYLLKPSSLILHLMSYLFLFITHVRNCVMGVDYAIVKHVFVEMIFSTIINWIIPF